MPGPLSFHQWRAGFHPKTGQHYEPACLAINNNCERQRFAARGNPAGFLLNRVETCRVSAIWGGEP